MINQPTTKEETTMTQVDQYREYDVSTSPRGPSPLETNDNSEADVVENDPAPPHASTKDIELLSQTIAIRIFAMRSNHSLAEVLSDGYFDCVRDVRFRKEDRIELVASWGKPVAEHATLVVTDSDKHGLATVSLMHLYQRGI